MCIQAHVNAQRYLVVNPNSECCKPLLKTIKWLQVIYLVISLVPVIFLGVALVQIRNITVEQAKSTRMLIFHFTVVILVTLAGLACTVDFVLLSANRGSTVYVAVTMTANFLFATE